MQKWGFIKMEKETKPVKGYTSLTVCLDGENSHDFKNDIMMEEGIIFGIEVCTKCGFWN